VRQDVLGGELDTDSTVLPSNGSTDITLDSKSEEEWDIDCSYFNNVKSNFEARRQGKPKHVFSASDRELEYFSKLFDDILTLIMNETNLYAKQNFGSGSPSKNWVDTTIQEMKAFIGCLILMGIHQLPALSHFWSSDPLLNVDAIADVMMSKRFKKLVENIHCNNNETKKPRDHAEYDKLHKLRPFIEKLLQNCKDNYEPSSFLSVDESMIPFKGRSSMKQYMPMKPVKQGYKVWCLSDSNSGYIIKFDTYTGKCKTNSDFTLGERVVAELMKEICKENTLVAFDRFFTTVKLMLKFLKKGVYATPSAS
jgi:hypothetical protein